MYSWSLKKEHSVHSEAVLPLLSHNYILATLQDSDKPGYTNFISVFWRWLFLVMTLTWSLVTQEVVNCI